MMEKEINSDPIFSFANSGDGHQGDDTLNVNIAAYLGLLDSVGAKALGLLVTLAALSKFDDNSGRRLVEGAQEEIGAKVSGGDGGWSPSPTRDALDVLITKGLIEKIPSRALGRSRGATAPQWCLPDRVWSTKSVAKGAGDKGALPLVAPTIDPPNTGLSKIQGSKKAVDSARLGPRPLGHLSLASPHVMDVEDISHTCSDDNDENLELLALAVTRALRQMGWVDAPSAVSRFGAHPLAAWIATSRERDNPGGFIRSQTKKSDWPFYPQGWVPGASKIVVDEHGVISIGIRNEPSPAKRALPVKEILEILETAGELGTGVKRAWLEGADRVEHPTPESRSRFLQESGAKLLLQYGLISEAGEVRIA